MKKTKHTMLTAAILTAAASAITASGRTVNNSDSVETPQMTTIIKEEPELFSAVYGPPPAAYRDGDVNGDGKVDVRDLTAVLQFRHEDKLVYGNTKEDINQDGRVDDLDVISLLNFLEGKETEPCIEGDILGNGRLDKYDLSQFPNMIEFGWAPESYDINHDGVVDYGDTETFLEQYRKYGDLSDDWQSGVANLGDVNLDDQVDLTDYKLLKERIQEETPKYQSRYDLRQDSFIDEKDLAALYDILIDKGYTESEILNNTEEPIQTKYGVFPVKNDLTE